MKTILLATLGSAGDVYPMLALGQYLKALGQRPVIVTNPYFEPLAAQAGLPFVPLGTAEDYQRTMDDPDLWSPTRGLATVAKHGIIPLLHPLYELGRQSDPHQTILATSVFLFGARIAHEAHGIPLVQIHLQPSLFRSVYDPPNLAGFRLPDWLPHGMKRAYFRLLDAAFIDPLLARPINAFRAEVGLAPVKRIFNDWMFSPQKNLCLFPDWFAPPQPDWSSATELTGFVQWKEADASMNAPAVQAFLDAGEPPLVFTPGTAMQHAQSFFQESVATAQQLGRRAILLTRHQAHLPAQLPTTIRHFEYLPLGQLLPRAAALIYHGGAGTMAQALAAGVPHLVVPFSHDQPDNARLLHRLGVGDFLRPPQYRAAVVAEKLQQLLTSPTTRSQCAAFARRVDFDQALATSCAAILDI
jgi:rhamnosyltransferase subunit B